jgi:hypothetical protein
MKVFEKGNLVLWMPKDENIKSGKFRMPWEGPYKVEEVYNKNIIKLLILSNEKVEKINVNKLKFYNIVELSNVMMTMIHVTLDYDEIIEPKFAIQTQAQKFKKRSKLHKPKPLRPQTWRQ